jgi:DNA processing protein
MCDRVVTTDDATPYWVAFNHVPGIGPTRLAALVARFGDVAAAWRAPAAALADVLDERSHASMLTVRHALDLERTMARIRALGAAVVTLASADYPDRLRQVVQAPYVLYVLGDVSLLQSRAVSVVGTRRPTDYGLRATRAIAGDLAAAGVTVVSGLALGIDGAAHRAALDAHGATVAVLGCGPDIVYPPMHGRLFADVVRHGAVVSEYPPGTPPDAGNFPARNRIVSGLSLATVVVEAGEQSGALITARIALDHGRDVFAVPGSIFSAASAGTNGLIAVGAGLIASADDVLAALDLTHLAAQTTARQLVPADATEASLLAELGGEPTHIDVLIRQSGRGSAEVTRALAIMELKGLVHHMGNMCWTAAR